MGRTLAGKKTSGGRAVVLGSLLGLAACSHSQPRLTTEEADGIRQHFIEAVKEELVRREQLPEATVAVDRIEPQAEDQVLLSYHVHAERRAGASPTTTEFASKVTLKRGADGVWNAVEMLPEHLDVEFARGLSVRRLPAAK